MASLFAIYPHAQLIETSSNWKFYKEIEDAPLILYKSENKYPGKMFFTFSSLTSSVFVKFDTIQVTMNDPMYVKILTKNGHIYFFKVWY